MKFIKRTISCCLAVAITFGGVYAKPAESTDESIKAKSNITRKVQVSNKQKLLYGGLATAALAAIGIVSSRYLMPLPVLIVGGTEKSRSALIEDLKNGEAVANDKNHDSITNFIEGKTWLGANGTNGVSKLRSKFKNWKISHCSADDENVSRLMKRSRLIIALLDSSESMGKIDKLICENTDLRNCMVVNIVDETEWANLKEHYSYWEQQCDSDDAFKRVIWARCGEVGNLCNKDGGFTQERISYGTRLNKDLGFVWDRNEKRYVCYRWST